MKERLLEWRAEFSMGVGSVDYEHQELIALINRLYADYLQRRSLRRTSDFLGELYAKISAHFALEERVMKELAYPGYQMHKDDHERLMDELLEIMENVDQGEDLDAELLGSRLDHWFSEHFRTQDAQFHKSYDHH